MHTLSLWGGGFGLPETVALAAVAVIGYVFGRRDRSPTQPKSTPSELLRAADIARQLEQVAAALRSDLAAHQADIGRFKEALDASDEVDHEVLNRRLRSEAERVLEPTLRLVGRVAKAYDQIRRQSRALSDFSGGRTDPLTGLCNRLALGELLQVELAGHAAVDGRFSVALFGLPESPDASRAEREAQLLLAVELLRGQLRDADLLARYGLDELVVMVPHTRLYGVSMFARRVRDSLREAGVPVSCGLAQSLPGDDPGALLGRADSALYSAKAAGGDSQYLHNGRAIRADLPKAADAEARAHEEHAQHAEHAPGAELLFD